MSNRYLSTAAGVLLAGAAALFVFPSAGWTEAARQYTFSWPLTDGESAKPRGGSTRGAPVTLERSASPAWQALQAPDLSAFERDRRAILAMAGDYRVTFDFLEVVTFAEQEKRDRPYQSWGTEKIYVDIDTGRTISLVHILEMRFIQDDGRVSEPMVAKHWRQDWQYEPTHIVEYQGSHRWERCALSAAESKGVWMQTVHQVDESPRYASIGRWVHSSSFSTWLSGETWRPLPRREWSVRGDYQVLIGTNRHTVQATGWVQEENNLKAVLTESGDPASPPYLAREYGVARYERIRDADFAAADRYYENTRTFWHQVRDRWNEVFVDQGDVTLKGPIDQLGLFRPLFAHAEDIKANGEKSAENNRRVIREALQAMGVPQ